VALTELNMNPSERELRWFGALLGVFGALVGALLRWRFDAPTAAGILWCLTAAVTAAYYLLPPLRWMLYRAWMTAAFPIGWLVSHAVLAIAYFLVFAATGAVMRLFGRDPLHRRFDPGAASYWVERRASGDPDRYFRLF
jgi:hypothetical protein